MQAGNVKQLHTIQEVQAADKQRRGKQLVAGHENRHGHVRLAAAADVCRAG
jgi:hypothetical protein